jgi:hypothetical protein
MGIQHFNYFWWDSEGSRIFLSRTFSRIFFVVKCRVKEEREVKRNACYSAGQVVEEGNAR